MSKKVPRFLICNGDPSSYLTHGGLPYNLLKESKKNGLLDSGITLNYRKLKYFKYIWNLIQFIKYRNFGGFQYSYFYTNKLIKQILISPDIKINILSIYPLLPNYPWSKKWTVDFYIDATTKQILENYSIGKNLNKEFKDKILKREKINYLNSKNIICRSNWAAKSLLEDYQIDKNKVHVIPGGANLDLKEIKSKSILFIPPKPSKNNPIVLGFLGRDWDRKGGSFLISLADVFYRKNIPFQIRVIGPLKKNIPLHPNLKYVGFLDKFKNLDLFINELKSWHYGTLFSKAEAFGISNRECLILGVPVICHDIGGIASTLPKSDFGKIFKSNPNPEFVYEWIINSFNPYNKYVNLREKLFNKRSEFTWDTAVKNLKDVLD
tara:strand:+ start:369 stop:1505 length:1137 start_codon:yes stop_codon:yes gene_type:complete